MLCWHDLLATSPHICAHEDEYDDFTCVTLPDGSLELRAGPPSSFVDYRILVAYCPFCGREAAMKPDYEVDLIRNPEATA